MATYEFRCCNGHVTELTQPMTAELPSSFTCLREIEPEDSAYEIDVTPGGVDRIPVCGQEAKRVFGWAATHYKGSGFYATDVQGKLHRKRRRNAGDDLPRQFDHDTAMVASGI